MGWPNSEVVRKICTVNKFLNLSILIFMVQRKLVSLILFILMEVKVIGFLSFFFF